MADYAEFQAKADAGAAWANPLNHRERAALARRLARACGRFYQHRTDGMASVNGRYSLDDTDTIYMRTMASAEMSELHLDVTERAAVPQT